LRVTWTYSRNQDANAAAQAINDTLAAHGRTETCTRSGTTVDVVVEPLDNPEPLRDALLADWNRGTRSDGKASVVMRDEAST
jgi:hypothetical protein